MQLAIERRSRFVSILFVVCLFAGWGALTGALPVKTALAADHNHGAARFDRLPVMKLTEEQIRALPQGQQRLDRELHRQGEYNKRWHEIHDLVGAQHLSKRAGHDLRSRGLGAALMDKADAALSVNSRSGGTDTLKVLIIRIGFETNRNPHLTTIHPSGDFDLGIADNPDTLYVDPPPHNKAFYESHLVGLSEYYRYQSGGRLHIQGEVLPRGEGDSYKLTDVADYGPGADNFWSLESLESLVRDCIVLADSETQTDGSGINLADYDDTDPFRYIIFVHAGSDYQSDILQDSPNDIPTFFITLGEPQAMTSINSQTGLPGSMSECSIIPETTNQDGYPGSIAAAFYHEFGHALGLVDIYSTRTALPQVGIWDLMDSGTNLPVTMGKITAEGDTIIVSATGVLPPSLSAWDKWFLGWIEMDEIDGRLEDYELPPIGIPRSEYGMYSAAGIGNFDLGLPQAIKGGLSTREWFLMENRYVLPADYGEDDTPFEALSFELDEETGVVLYLAGLYRGTWSNSGQYDFFMPAGGLLVWHVNMDRIEAELATNTINYYGDGLRLVEADGIQDIGVLDAYVLGWFGGYRDPFGEGNGFRNLYTEGFPSSRSFDRCWTGLSLSDIRATTHRSEVMMSFSANLDGIRSGFPFEVAPVDSATAVDNGGVVGPRALAVNSAMAMVYNNEPMLVFADQEPEDWSGGPFPASLFALDGTGQAVWSADEEDPVGLFHHLDAPLAGATVQVDHSFLVAGTVSGRMDVLLLQSGSPSLYSSTAVCDSLVQGPLALEFHLQHRILCSAYPDSLIIVELDGERVGEGLQLLGSEGAAYGPGDAFKGTSSVLSFFDDVSAAAVPMKDGWFFVQQMGFQMTATWYEYPRTLAGESTHAAVIPSADMRTVQYHLFDDEGALGSWLIRPDGTPEGTIEAIDPLYAVDTALVTEPAVADVDGDGQHDIVLATSERILAYHPDGVGVRGFPVKLYDLFPLPDSTSITGPLIVADATGNGVNEVFFSTSGGHLLGLDAVGQLMSYTPLKWGDRRNASFSVGPGSDDDPGRIMWMISEGGYAGAPLGRQYTNGRVMAYQFTDASAEIGTSEWLGYAGGSFRNGTTGSASNLGTVAPMAAELDQILIYPNPLHDEMLTVRFVPKGDRPAKFGVYNLEGEMVIQQEFLITSDVINEHSLDLSHVVSGLYVCRLMFEGANGIETKVMTLAVER